MCSKQQNAQTESSELAKTTDLQTAVTFVLGDWVQHELKNWPAVISDLETQMDLAIRLSAVNINHGGGPYGAAVFDEEGRLISVGVNLVVAQSASVLHAEVFALTLAQHRVGNFTLKSEKGPKYRLVSSSAPCVACFGCFWWSGAQELIIGARKEDIERLTTFAEGPINPQWRESLRERNVLLLEDVRREQACVVLSQYSKQNGVIYNG